MYTNIKCNNCKWYNIYKHRIKKFELCKKVLTIKYEKLIDNNNYRDILVYYPTLCDSINMNRNNDCTHFERKWYKFWVKKPTPITSDELCDKLENILKKLVNMINNK